MRGQATAGGPNQVVGALPGESAQGQLRIEANSVHAQSVPANAYYVEPVPTGSAGAVGRPNSDHRTKRGHLRHRSSRFKEGRKKNIANKTTVIPMTVKPACFVETSRISNLL